MDLGLANAAAVVVGGDRDALDSAAADLTGRGSPDSLGVVADIGDAAAVDKVFVDLAARWDGAVFLASRRNSHMNGANINVDGGSDFT